jgi:ubiquitin C-terminal hydrolase
MNAILQCLIHTPLVKSYFISDLYRNHIKKKKNEETLADIISEFAREYERANYPAKILWKIKSAIEKYVPHFQGYDQHDAQEFLGMLIDKLNDELTVTRTTEGSNSSENNKVSIMGDLFCGELCSMIECPYCKNVSEKKEPFYYLSVPLPLKVIVVESYRKVF